MESFAGKFVNDRIECEADAETISRSVHENGVAMLTGVLDARALDTLRETVFSWAQRTEPQRESDSSFHRIDNRPPTSKTPHVFHAYNFYLREGRIERAIDQAIRPFFTAMKHLQNAVTGTNADFEPDADGRYLRPQVLQYPSGGGFFDGHEHPYEPQRVGLIAGLSQQGRDFETGGTWFEFNGKRISIENRHNIGDIALFKYDIPHGISVIDEGDTLDWNSQRGRWTMVLPIIDRWTGS